MRTPRSESLRMSPRRLPTRIIATDYPAIRAARAARSSTSTPSLQGHRTMQPQKRTASRRDFLRYTAATGAGYWVAGGIASKASASPNEQLQIACFGVGGKGHSDVTNAARFGKIYALCDVDRPSSTCPLGRTRCPTKTSSPTSARCSTRWATRSTPSSSARPTTPTP